MCGHPEHLPPAAGSLQQADRATSQPGAPGGENSAGGGQRLSLALLCNGCMLPGCLPQICVTALPVGFSSWVCPNLCAFH